MSTSVMGRGFPWLLVGVLGLGACQTSPPAAPRDVSSVPSLPQPAIPADAREYRVVAEQSMLQILVYRGGPMARLGHNHVIASRHLEGAVYVTEDLARTQFDIRIPVNQLTVDEPAMREAAGTDFPPGVPQSARDGTRNNLLSEALLDGANHPVIGLRATDVKPGAQLDVGVAIMFKDQLYTRRVPLQVERREGVIVARGEFTLNQSELGLRPFSVAMGTLVVLDEMRIRFEVTAETAGPDPIS
jgi:polyisoprenoid-binding protein YceI